MSSAPVATGVPSFATLRYAGSRAPYTLLWREVGRDGSQRTHETVADPVLAVSVVAALTAPTVTAGRAPAADLDTIAALLQAQGQLDNDATDHRRAIARRAELVDALTRWLDTVKITPRTVDDPVEPLHGTRCALASAARTLLNQILTAHGVPAPERM